MNSVTVKDIHSTSHPGVDAELHERLRPVAGAVRQRKFANGGYLSYYDETICPTTAHAVHEYADRKQLMWMDTDGKEHLIKVVQAIAARFTPVPRKVQRKGPKQ